MRCILYRLFTRGGRNIVDQPKEVRAAAAGTPWRPFDGSRRGSASSLRGGHDRHITQRREASILAGAGDAVATSPNSGVEDRGGDRVSRRITQKARALAAARALERARQAGVVPADPDALAAAAIEAAAREVQRRTRALRAAGRNPRARGRVDRDDTRPTPEQLARDSYGDVETLTQDARGAPVCAVAKRNLTAEPLDRYLKRGRIERGAWEAGDRFRRQWHVSGLERNMVSGYDGIRIDGADPAWQIPVTERQAQARQAVRAALAGVGKLAGSVLIGHLVLEHTARDIGHLAGRRGKYAEVAGMERIRMALAILAHTYGIALGDGGRGR